MLQQFNDIARQALNKHPSFKQYMLKVLPAVISYTQAAWSKVRMSCPESKCKITHLLQKDYNYSQKYMVRINSAEHIAYLFWDA